MKTIKLTKALYLISLLGLFNCTTVKETTVYQKTYGERLAIENLECSTITPENVDVFCKDESIEFNYKKIGYVTSFAKKSTPDSLIFKRLQYESYLLCGNGILDVEEVKSTAENSDYIKYSATAVIIEKDSIYYSKYQNKSDFSFYTFAKNDNTFTKEEIEFEPIATLLSATAVITSIIIVIIKGDSETDEEEYYEVEEDYGFE